MTYSANVHRLLVSSPGDVPLSDLAIVRNSINRWNGVYGHQFGSVVVPISWGTHAAAEFGRPPQAVLNDQLVDNCDICIALFANRLGTKTSEAESGTDEEIRRLRDAGRYVAILKSRRQVEMETVDLEQATRLQSYLDQATREGLILSYADDAELHNHVDAILNTAVARDRAKAEAQLTMVGHPAARTAEVWPRVESTEQTESDSRGRIKTRRRWYLVLTNTGDAPAYNVSFTTESPDDGESWFINGDQDEVVETLAPHGDMRFSILATLGSPQQVRCTVRWRDDRGNQENAATLRLV